MTYMCEIDKKSIMSQWIFKSANLAIFPRFLWRHPPKTGQETNFWGYTWLHVNLGQNCRWHITKYVYIVNCCGNLRISEKMKAKGQKFGKGCVILKEKHCDTRSSDICDENHNKSYKKCVKTQIERKQEEDLEIVQKSPWLIVMKCIMAISSKTKGHSQTDSTWN